MRGSGGLRRWLGRSGAGATRRAADPVVARFRPGSTNCADATLQAMGKAGRMKSDFLSPKALACVCSTDPKWRRHVRKKTTRLGLAEPGRRSLHGRGALRVAFSS